jgi:hypothetical protein
MSRRVCCAGKLAEVPACLLQSCILRLGSGCRRVQFDVDTNGKLTVSAGDALSGERRTVTAYSHITCGLPCGVSPSAPAT